ncbi:type II toxin-antitoxin system ParD family antitoxin, partial [Escherichia coli]
MLSSNSVLSYSGRFTMRTTQQFSITLTNEMADMVRARVASGAYASE